MRDELWTAVAAFAIFGQAASAASADWQDLRTASDAVEAHPKRMRALLEAVDLSREGLAPVRRAFANGELAEACETLLAYYREGDTADWLRERSAEVSDAAVAHADRIVEEDIYRGYGERGVVPRGDDGHLDWTHRGPNGDSQFTNKLNRHHHLSTLLTVYLATGKAKYVERIDRDLRDWLTASGGEPARDGFGTSHLEPGLRLPTWSRVFFALQDDDAFRPATRLLLLAAIPDHAEYLLAHPGGNNWVTMTQLGALHCGVCWPELEGAERWRREALAKLRDNAERTVYPDGAQKELTAHYHLVSVGRYQDAAELMQSAGYELPDDFRETMERMWSYAAYAMRPSGTIPLNNDSDLVAIRDRVQGLADAYARPDWRYIATNGEAGARPDGPPSRFFPWAGQLVSRSGWGAEAHWSLFDVGPWGSGHQHDDKLHVSVSVYGRDLLVDSGRFAYQGEIARRFRGAYARHTRGHNTILIDGEGQGPGPKEADRPHPLHAVREAFDFALATAPSQGEARHTRAVVYLRGRGWLVLDHLRGPGRHRAEAVWHLHPDAGARVDGRDVVTDHGGEGHLRISPLGSLEAPPAIVKGREEPEPQGWYSRTYGEYEPAPCAVYETAFEGSTTFGWALTPAREAPEAPEIEWLEAPDGVARLRLGDGDAASRTVTVVLDEDALPVTLPDGRRLAARLLVEAPGEEPAVACGALRDAAPEASDDE